MGHMGGHGNAPVYTNAAAGMGAPHPMMGNPAGAGGMIPPNYYPRPPMAGSGGSPTSGGSPSPGSEDSDDSNPLNQVRTSKSQRVARAPQRPTAKLKNSSLKLNLLVMNRGQKSS